MKPNRPQRAALLALLAVCAGLFAAGCKQGPFQPTTAGVAQPAAGGIAAATTAQNNVWQQQAQSLAVQVQDLTRRVGQLDVNNSDLHRQLAQAEQQRTQYTDQIALLQKQLGEMANKAKDMTLAKQEADKQLTALQASTQFRGGASISARVTARRASATTSLILRQLARTPQESWMPQAPSCRLHAVMPSGPSIASTISTRLMSDGSRASR